MTRPIPFTIWVWGPTGTGKSQLAVKLANAVGENCTYFLSPPGKNSTTWFDGYLPFKHKVLVMDDFRASTLKMEDFLTLASNLPRNVQGKGISSSFSSSVIVVTSPEEPWRCYAQSATAQDSIAQVVRRVNLAIEMIPSSDQIASATGMPVPGAIAPSFVMPYQDIAATFLGADAREEFAAHAWTPSSTNTIEARAWAKVATRPRQKWKTRFKIWWSHTDEMEPSQLHLKDEFERVLAEAKGEGEVIDLR
jgi:hypothetical protein